MSKLILNNLHHSFENKPLFNGLSLSVGTGEVVAIVGASGVGKTTLFNIVAGLIAPSGGQVLIDGVDRTGQAGFVGYMLQKDLLLPFKSVYDNIALPLTLKGVAKDKIKAEIDTHLTAFGLDGLTHKYPHQLSGGQRQRVALLRTYLSNDNLMLLDEPFSALDYVTKHQMYGWFNEFQKSLNLTCLMITHDIDEAIYLADKIYVLKGFPAHFSDEFVLDKGADFVKSAGFWEMKERILGEISTP